MTEKDISSEETKVSEDAAKEENPPFIFKNLNVDRFKDTKKIAVASFEEIAKKNQERLDKLAEERKKNNKNVLRSFRIK